MLSLAQQILALDAQGVPTLEIAARLGVKRVYVRAVRSRYRNKPPPAPRPPRPRKAVVRPSPSGQPRVELRALAEKLWEMHQTRIEQEARP